MATRRSFLRTIGALSVAVAAGSAPAEIASVEKADENPKGKPDVAFRPMKQAAKQQQTEPRNVETYLSRMPELSSVVEQAVSSGKKPLTEYSILLVHHLTGEVLGVIAALRKLGCRDIVTVFVGYNADLESVYRPDLRISPKTSFAVTFLAANLRAQILRMRRTSFSDRS